jgi:hypothetical protein
MHHITGAQPKVLRTRRLKGIDGLKFLRSDPRPCVGCHAAMGEEYWELTEGPTGLEPIRILLLAVTKGHHRTAEAMLSDVPLARRGRYLNARRAAHEGDP